MSEQKTTNQALLNFILDSNAEAKNVIKDAVSNAETSALDTAKGKLTSAANSVGTTVDDILANSKKSVDGLKAKAAPFKSLSEQAAKLNEGFETALKNIGSVKLDESKTVSAAKTELKRVSDSAAKLLDEAKKIPVKGDKATEANKAFLEALEKTSKAAKEAHAKIDVRSLKDSHISAARDAIRSAQAEIKPAVNSLDSVLSKFGKTIEGRAAGGIKVLSGERKATPSLPVGTKDIKPDSFTSRFVPQEVSNASKTLADPFKTHLDPEKASKNGNVFTSRAVNDNTKTAAKEGTSWVSRLAPSEISKTFKESGTGIKFGRVAGTGVGLAMVYDGISRGKSGDQDRSALVRIGEVAAGLGVAGASLAYRG